MTGPADAGRLAEWERLTAAATPVLLKALELSPSDRLLDIGCGVGGATLGAAGIVGPDGSVTGADISPSAVVEATRRATHLGVGNVSFQVADLQTHRPHGAPFTAAMSQFGVMFFSEPATAFANIRSLLRPGGRLCFACWQAAEQNPWSYAHLLTGMLGARARGDAHAPGPFALADADRLAGWLRGAGFLDIEAAPHEDVVDVPESAVYDDTELARMGVPPGQMARARKIVTGHLSRFRTPANSLRLPLAYFVVAART